MEGGQWMADALWHRSRSIFGLSYRVSNEIRRCTERLPITSN
jgi:hypothetical protein